MPKLKLVCLSFFAACAALGAAQNLPAGVGLDLVHRGAYLLADARIQAKVKLTPSQQETVNKLVAEHSEWQTAQLQSARPNLDSMADTDLATSRALLGALTPDQAKALKRETFRAAGYDALLAPEITKQLDLTLAQQHRITTILNAAQAPVDKLEEIIGRQVAEDPKSTAAMMRAYDRERAKRAKQKELDGAKALTILTPAQLTTWKGLTE